ncbi:hypothetical protein EDB85DRAFT_2162656 [Lactarius pseudohatsudake]|nr:hypothetical protein EDB85DRAFT_2162656 [Lactarius pseudohatsudake]
MGNQKLGWMAIFGRNMDDSPMVVVWPSCGADGEYNSVALSHRKVPYGVMPTPDPHPPFALAHRYLCACSPRLFPSSRSVQATLENPRIVFTRNNIIGAIQPHAGIGGLGCSHININTPQNWPQHAQLWRASLPSLLSHQSHPPPPPPVHSHSHPKSKDDDDHDDEKAEDEGESHDDEGGGGSSASFLHGALCTVTTVRLLLVLLSGAVVARYAKATGSPRVFLLHRLLPFGVAGASITGGTLAYLFMHNHGSMHDWSWFHRILEESCTGVHGVLLAGLGGVIDLLAFFETWLGLISAGQSALLFTVPSLYAIGVMPVQRRFGSVKEDAKGEFVALDMRHELKMAMRKYRMP